MADHPAPVLRPGGGTLRLRLPGRYGSGPGPGARRRRRRALRRHGRCDPAGRRGARRDARSRRSSSRLLRSRPLPRRFGAAAERSARGRSRPCLEARPRPSAAPRRSPRASPPRPSAAWSSDRLTSRASPRATSGLSRVVPEVSPPAVERPVPARILDVVASSGPAADGRVETRDRLSCHAPGSPPPPKRLENARSAPPRPFVPDPLAAGAASGRLRRNTRPARDLTVVKVASWRCAMVRPGKERDSASCRAGRSDGSPRPLVDPLVGGRTARRT